MLKSYYGVLLVVAYARKNLNFTFKLSYSKSRVIFFFRNTLLLLKLFKNMSLKHKGVSCKHYEPKTKRKDLKYKSNREEYSCLSKLICPHYITIYIVP